MLWSPGGLASGVVFSTLPPRLCPQSFKFGLAHGSYHALIIHVFEKVGSVMIYLEAARALPGKSFSNLRTAALRADGG